MQPGLRKHSAQLIERELVAQGTYQLTFLMEDEFPFVPGQYVWVELGESRKAFSICCPPNGRNSISIVFRESLSDYKKNFLSLPLHSQISIYGPFGSLALPVSPETPVVFIAGGVGVAPFLSMIRESISKNSLRPIHLVYANASPERAVYSSALKQMAKEHKTFTLQEVYGHITLQDLKNLSELQNSIIYTIGPAGMVDAVGALLVSLGVSRDKVRFEEFYPKPFAPTNALLVHGFPLTKELFTLVVQHTSNHIVLTDIDGRVMFANKAAEVLTGYSFEEMRGQTARLWGGLMEKTFYANLWEMVKVKQESFSGKVYNRRKNGEVYVAFMRISPILERDGTLIGFMSTEEDVTELENISDLKTEFVSLAAHQLRTPLTVIRWELEELLVAPVGSEFKLSQRKSLQDVHQKALEMIGLVKKLLDVSHLELGQYVMKLESTDLPSISQKILLEQRALVRKKKLHLTELYGENLSEIDTDPEFVQIILQNFISNAVKYSPSGGTIEVEISLSQQKNIFIRVSDMGIGIPKQQQSRIFQAFSRAENVKKIETTGFGFGLYMTKLIVEHLSGKIWFESTEGKGTTFYVLLPVQS